MRIHSGGTRLASRNTGFFEGMSVRSKDLAVFAALSFCRPAWLWRNPRRRRRPPSPQPTPWRSRARAQAQPPQQLQRRRQPQQAMPQPGVPQPSTQPATRRLPATAAAPAGLDRGGRQSTAPHDPDSAKEGLDPTDYDAAGLMAAMRSERSDLLSAASTERFNKLSSDLALGHVRGDDRQNWHIRIPTSTAPPGPAASRGAGAASSSAEALTGCFRRIRNMRRSGTRSRSRRRPTREDRPYPAEHGPLALAAARPRRALHHRQRAGLHGRAGRERRHRLEAPRGRGQRSRPRRRSSWRLATGVILNPWWEVPPSISKEVAGKPGYVALKGADGKVQRWRQPPGPRNALGQIKFVMYNPQNIYLHDTTAKTLFDAKARAYSHGCIRTEHVLLLAESLLTEGARTRPRTPEGTTDLDAGEGQRDRRQPEDGPGELPEAASGLHRLHVVGRAVRTDRSRTMPTSTRRTARSWRR